MPVNRDNATRGSESFNARTKCVPEWDDVVGNLEENFEEVEAKVRKACKCEETSGSDSMKHLGSKLNWTRLKKVCDELVEECEGGVKEATIRKLAQERLRNFIVAPVDKYGAEGAIIRQARWAEAIFEQAGDMTHVDPLEAQNRTEEMIQTLNVIEDAPYVGLRGT